MEKVLTTKSFMLSRFRNPVSQITSMAVIFKIKKKTDLEMNEYVIVITP